MSTLSPAAARRLRSTFAGRVRLPADAGFDEERRPWNLAIDQQVCAVIVAADAADVADALRFSTLEGIPIAAQPSGHGASGRTAGAMLLRTTSLDEIAIDPRARVARIGAGVKSGALQEAAAAHGLTALPGSSPVVSVTGAALGGGLSWFGRAFGWMADSIVAADVATPDGRIRRLTAEDDAELLWALRGGGGDLVVVTALEIRLREAPAIFGGRMLWQGVHTREVAECFRSITEGAPDSLTLWLELLHFPGSEPMVAIDSTYLGAEGEARDLVRAVRDLPVPLADARTTMSAGDLGSITNEPTTPGPGRSHGALLRRLDDDALAALTDESIAPLMTVQVRHLGGALAEASDSPHGPIDSPYAAYMFGVPADAAVAAAITSKQAALVAALPVAARKPITFLNPSEGLRDALPEASIQRLQRLKLRCDPANLVRGNFPIPSGEAP